MGCWWSRSDLLEDQKNTLIFKAKAWWTLARHRLYPTTGDNVLSSIWAAMIEGLIARYEFYIGEFLVW